mgnify:CR=1 FL=1
MLLKRILASSEGAANDLIDRIVAPNILSQHFQLAV